jgi:hypothetical protein
LTKSVTSLVSGDSVQSSRRLAGVDPPAHRVAGGCGQERLLDHRDPRLESHCLPMPPVLLASPPTDTKLAAREGQGAPCNGVARKTSGLFPA